MTGTVLGIAFSLLLLPSVIQGLRGVELIHNERLEAVTGQNISLPCVVKNVTSLQVVSLEWRKDEETKLGVYNKNFGHSYYWSNVTIQVEKNDENKVLGSRLLIPWVNKWDSGVYVCDITSFPLGSIRTETNLIVKDDIKIACDSDGVTEVSYGGNATIHCTVLSDDAQYRWTKNEMLVSENGSLELWLVTDAHAGVYKLTVNTRDKTLHKDFIISVLTATTSQRTDSVTSSTQGPTDSAHSSLTTLQTTELSVPVNWTTHPNLSDAAVTAVEDITSSIGLTPTSIPSSADTHSNSYNSLNSPASDEDTTDFRSTQETVSKETRNESRLHTPEPTGILSGSIEELSTKRPDSAPTDSVKVTPLDAKNRGTKRSHLFLALIVVSLMLVIVVICILKIRQVKLKRMDLPPPFKPPPPPIKYTAAQPYNSSAQCFPTSRCNSIAEPRDMRQTPF